MTAALTWAEGVFLIPWVQLPGWWFALRHKKPVSSFRGQGCRSPRSAGGQGSHLWGHPWHSLPVLHWSAGGTSARQGVCLNQVLLTLCQLFYATSFPA